MVAIGGYLKGRREALNMSPAEVVVAMKALLHRNVDTSTIWKIENATINAGSDLLFAFLAVVGGSGAQALDLTRRSVSASEAERIGRMEVQRGSDEVLAKLRQLPADEQAVWESRLQARLDELH